jgi:hypothetical protein
MRVVGFLNGNAPGTYAPYVAAFRRGLGETGYVEGQNLAIDTAGLRATMIGCPHWLPTSSVARLT